MGASNRKNTSVPGLSRRFAERTWLAHRLALGDLQLHSAEGRETGTNGGGQVAGRGFAARHWFGARPEIRLNWLCHLVSHVSIGNLNRLCQPKGDRKRGQIQSLTLAARESWSRLPDHLHAARAFSYTRNTFITSSPRWLITFTAMRPDCGLVKGRDVSLCSVAQASSLISAFSVVFRAL